MIERGNNKQPTGAIVVMKVKYQKMFSSNDDVMMWTDIRGQHLTSSDKNQPERSRP